MKASGSRIFERSPEELWNLLTSPHVVQHSIPGCELLEATGPHEYRVVLKIGYGLLGGKLEGKARLLGAVEPETYRLEIRARGKVGSVDGLTDVHLARLDGGQRTELSYETDLRLGGLLSSLGGRFFRSAVQSFLERFFEGLERA